MLYFRSFQWLDEFVDRLESGMFLVRPLPREVSENLGVGGLKSGEPEVADCGLVGRTDYLSALGAGAHGWPTEASLRFRPSPLSTSAAAGSVSSLPQHVARFISLMPMYGPTTSYTVTRGIHIFVSSRLLPSMSELHLSEPRQVDPIVRETAPPDDGVGGSSDEIELTPAVFVYVYRVFMWCNREGDVDAPFAQLERRRWSILDPSVPGGPDEVGRPSECVPRIKACRL